jgi:hypothetical protein
MNARSTFIRDNGGRVLLFEAQHLYNCTGKSSETQALATQDELNAVIDLVSQGCVILETHPFFFRCDFLEVQRLMKRSECLME